MTVQNIHRRIVIQRSHGMLLVTTVNGWPMANKPKRLMGTMQALRFMETYYSGLILSFFFHIMIPWAWECGLH